MDFASAFGTFLEGGKVLLARDTRFSSPMLHSAVVSSLLSSGCEILDLGICPAPILQFSVRTYRAAGAISISGGHNPMGWNAITLIGPDGAVLEPLGGQRVLDCFHAGDFRKQNWENMGIVREVDDYSDPYFNLLAGQLNVSAIQKAKFGVIIDPVGGSGCQFLEPFAQLLGIKVVPMNAQHSGYLAREAEPRPRSAIQIASIIRQLGGDAGFVLSSDMGRLSLVSETGEPASEEFTFAIIADHVLRKEKGSLVTNCCSSRMMDDLAQLHKVPLVKTRVGQSYVMSRLLDEQGILGGEGNGSVALAKFSRAFDGFLMMGLVLEAMAEGGKKLSELLGNLPRYSIEKRYVACDPRKAYRAVKALQDRWESRTAGNVDHTDGLRIDWPDGWVHARASRTEQLLRVISEASDRTLAQQRAEEAVRILEQQL
jgi:phosphomannomutase